ncbi:MAG: electron transfer flavoprotein subunit beta/FixA family protein [Desulfobacterales bacterium]|nr:electron transfer flavoprotein subunit beta/FixA family protein [Desulfobacterales bacterium]
MKILVCIKQVPNIEAQLNIDNETGWISAYSPVEYRMNRFDEYALEEALKIKESHLDVTIDVISSGPERVIDVLKRAIGMGADNGIHINHLLEGFIPPEVVAELISQYALNQKYDLIFTGIMAEDDMQCLVGPMIAATMNLNCAVSVIQMKLDAKKKIINVICELEGGIHQSIQLSLPVLLTIQTGINKPRYPSLSNMLRAKKQIIQVILAKDLSKQYLKPMYQVVSLPQKSSTIQFIDGSSEEKAEKLLNILYAKSLLK